MSQEELAATVVDNGKAAAGKEDAAAVNGQKAKAPADEAQPARKPVVVTDKHGNVVDLGTRSPASTASTPPVVPQTPANTTYSHSPGYGTYATPGAGRGYATSQYPADHPYAQYAMAHGKKGGAPAYGGTRGYPPVPLDGKGGHKGYMGTPPGPAPYAYPASASPAPSNGLNASTPPFHPAAHTQQAPLTQHTPPRCPSGHVLTQTHGAQLVSDTNGALSECSSIFCRLCDKEDLDRVLNGKGFYFTCAACNWDCCLECAVSAGYAASQRKYTGKSPTLAAGGATGVHGVPSMAPLPAGMATGKSGSVTDVLFSIRGLLKVLKDEEPWGLQQMPPRRLAEYETFLKARAVAAGVLPKAATSALSPSTPPFHPQQRQAAPAATAAALPENGGMQKKDPKRKLAFSVGDHVVFVGGGRFPGNQRWSDGARLTVNDLGTVMEVDKREAWPVKCQFDYVYVKLDEGDIRPAPPPPPAPGKKRGGKGAVSTAGKKTDTVRAAMQVQKSQVVAVRDEDDAQARAPAPAAPREAERPRPLATSSAAHAPQPAASLEHRGGSGPPSPPRHDQAPAQSRSLPRKHSLGKRWVRKTGPSYFEQHLPLIITMGAVCIAGAFLLTRRNKQ